MRQFVGSVRDDSTVRDLLVSVAPPAVRAAAAEARRRPSCAMMERDDEPTQMRYAQALADWADAGGYDAEVLWDTCTVAALGIPFEQAQWREVRTLSGGEQKRLVLEALLRGPDEVLLLDEPDNYLDVPGKRWLEDALRESPKTVLFVSHDRELLARYRDPRRHRRARAPPATRPGRTAAASRRTTRPAGTGSPGSRSCAGAGTRSTPSSRRWS